MWSSVGKALHLFLCLTAALLKYLIAVLQGALYFSFALGPANYLAGRGPHPHHTNELTVSIGA